MRAILMAICIRQKHMIILINNQLDYPLNLLDLIAISFFLIHAKKITQILSHLHIIHPGGRANLQK